MPKLRKAAITSFNLKKIRFEIPTVDKIRRVWKLMPRRQGTDGARAELYFTIYFEVKAEVAIQSCRGTNHALSNSSAHLYVRVDSSIYIYISGAGGGCRIQVV